MNIACTAIKGELDQVSEGKQLETKLRIRQYLKHAGLDVGRATDLPPNATSTISLDTEMLVYLLNINKLELRSLLVIPSTQEEKQSPRRFKLFSAICSRLKQGFLKNCYRRHKLPDMTVDSSDEMDEKWYINDAENDTDPGDTEESYQPASTQTVIHSDTLLLHTPLGPTVEPRPTTNILRFI